MLGVAIVFLSIAVASLYTWLKLYSPPNPKTISLDPSEKTFITAQNKQENFPESWSPSSFGIDLSVIVPAYNEEKRLDKMMEECVAHLVKKEKQGEFKWEIIIVVDGGTDNTVGVAQAWTKKLNNNNIRVLKLKTNRGKGGAVRRGVMVARGDYILFTDADGATKFSEVDKVHQALLKIVKNDHGVVVGSRAHMQGEAEAQRSFFRNVLMWGFHFAVKYVGGVSGIRDTQCGFKLFTRKSAQDLFKSMHIERWAFDVELLWLAQYWKIPVAEVSVGWTEIPGSHLEEEDTRLVSIKMLQDLLRVRLSYVFGLWTLPKKSE